MRIGEIKYLLQNHTSSESRSKPRSASRANSFAPDLSFSSFSRMMKQFFILNSRIRVKMITKLYQFLWEFHKLS